MTNASKMIAGNWYVQTFANGTCIWFRADRQLKNDGWLGRLVTRNTRKPKSKQESVPASYADLWKATSEVPSEVVAAA